MTHHHTQKKAQQRDDLTGEHAVSDVGQMVLACLFAVTWGADTFIFKYTTFINPYVPFSVRVPLAVFFLVLSGYLAKTGLSIVFGQERENPGVCRESVFNVIRHPVSLSEILL